MPLWLAPVQVVVCSIVDLTNDYILSIEKDLDKVGIRNQIDLRNEKIGYKIREHSNNGIPIIVVVGKKEEEKFECCSQIFRVKQSRKFRSC